MINNDKTLKISKAICELDNFITQEDVGNPNEWPYKQTRQVLEIMKEWAEKDKPFNDRLLRAFIDIGAITVRNYEDSKLEDAIFDLDDLLKKEIPNLDDYEPLRMDFGKGYPL